MAAQVLPAGTTINGRYTLSGKLGSDGDVYQAHDAHLNRTVAIKLLHPTGGQAQPWDEAQRLEALRSQFLVDVINADVITNSDIRFIVTPLLAGGDLEALAQPHGLSVREAVRFTQQLAGGVGRVHAAGMVHRDIKPANVLLHGDIVSLSDLEFCEIVDEDNGASRTGSWCTLAPEVAPDSGHCSIRSDIYSLGATAFYLMSGEYPVDHRLDRQVQKALIGKGELRDIRTMAPHVSQAVGTVVRKALSPDPAKRHETAEAFANALAHAARDTRNWQRVAHSGHTWCLHGDTVDGRSAVDICCRDENAQVVVAARLEPSGRRPRNVKDELVRKSVLPTHLQRLVKSLG